MGATRRNLQARPKSQNKLSEHQAKQSSNHVHKKIMFSILGAKNSYGDYPTTRPEILKNNTTLWIHQYKFKFYPVLLFQSFQFFCSSTCIEFFRFFTAYF
jgi:hypothetical protein